MTDGLTTPIEPAAGPGSRPDAAQARQWLHSNPFYRLDVAVASTCGSQHAANEDAHSAAGVRGRIFVVADGVGGGAMAQTASRLLVAHLHEALDGQRVDIDRVRVAVLDADRLIRNAIAAVTDLPGAATLVLAAPLDLLASTWLFAWVGDCRAYRLGRRGKAVEVLTRDETFGQLNETPPPGGSPDDPARMVGNGATAGPSVAIHEVAAGDLIVLCSDGVHKHMDDAEWVRLLRQPTSLARRCDDLVESARRLGSVDDATALVIERCEFGVRRPRWADRPGR